jgi:hypothetical protein
VAEKGEDILLRTQEQASKFLSALRVHPLVTELYGSELPELHASAILQHYGFPTNLLDCTYSADVALYFGEGGTDIPKPEAERAELGAMYGFPPAVVGNVAALVTLSPLIMRPSLQQGVFIASLDDEHRLKLERYKYVFRHQGVPIWNGFAGVTFGSPAGLGRYLFPASDPLHAIAQKYREQPD